MCLGANVILSNIFVPIKSHQRGYRHLCQTRMFAISIMVSLETEISSVISIIIMEFLAGKPLKGSKFDIEYYFESASNTFFLSRA